jgi:hypothetical protein
MPWPSSSATRLRARRRASPASRKAPAAAPSPSTHAIGAIVLLIAFYYTLVGLAALWTFRGEVLRSRSDFLRKGLAPLVGTAVLGWALIRNGRDTLDEDYGLTTLLGLGGVFVIGVATLIVGLLLMAAWKLRAPAFFRGETFAPGYLERHDPDLLGEVREA